MNEETRATRDTAMHDAAALERLRSNSDICTVSALRGRPVMDLSQGRVAGAIADTVLDTEGEKVVGFAVSPPGALTGLKFLPFQRLRAVGDDAVTVDSADWLEPPLSRDAANVTVSVRSLEEKRLLTAGGDLLGTVEDVLLNRRTGALAGYVLAGPDAATPRRYLLWTTGIRAGEDVLVAPDEAAASVEMDAGGMDAMRPGVINRQTGGTAMESDLNTPESTPKNTPVDTPGDTTVAGEGGLIGARETPSEARVDAEFQYVIGHVTLRDVIVDGQVVVPAGTEVTAGDAAGALAAGVLDDLAQAIGPRDNSQFNVHGRPEHGDADFSPDSYPDPDSDLVPSEAVPTDATPGG